MKCADFEPLWLARCDGRLAPGDEKRLGEHLTSCRRCARLSSALERLEFDLEAIGGEPAEAPQYLKTRIMASLAEERVPSRWSPLRLFTTRRVLAVSTACLAFTAGLLAREVHKVNDWVRKGRMQEVVLEFRAPEANLVSLAGDFNAWGTEAAAVQGQKVDGRWVFRLALKPGRYEYAFVIDGKKWLPDPGAPGIIPDGFGGMNSVLYVQADAPEQGRS